MPLPSYATLVLDLEALAAQIRLVELLAKKAEDARTSHAAGEARLMLSEIRMKAGYVDALRREGL